jgi:glutathione synthase/RimK-type ligase-like ATP-grasp enzyme
MVLVWGLMEDAVTAYVCTRLLARGVELLVLDGRHYPGEIHMGWSIEGGASAGWVGCGARRLEWSRIASVFVRHGRPPDRTPAAEENAEEKRRIQEQREGSLIAFLDAMTCRVVNRPSASSSNLSKPYQQQLIAREGFRVPRTLVTTVPEEVRAFYDACRGRVIYKSVSHRRSIVRRLTADNLERLEAVRACPTQFQEYVPGIDVRVHTVGERLFATEIETPAVDYRYAGRDGVPRQMRAVELPAEIAARCRRLAAALGLEIAGIDLRRTPAGEYCCFEVNPSPAFLFYESHTGQRIGEALVDHLCRGLS